MLTDLSFNHLFHEFVRLGSVLGAGDPKMKGHDSCPHGAHASGKKRKTKKQTITIQYDEYQRAPRSVSIVDNSQSTAVRIISDVSSLLLICKDLQNPLGI